MVEIIAERYEIIKSFAGGMGVVYLCKDKLDNDSPIALKTIQSKFFPNLESREKFLHEAQVWIELGWHPNIVQAYRAEYIIQTHEIYLALELIPTSPGRTDPSLRSWMTPNTPMPISKAMKIYLDIVRGMKFATSKIPGLVHRDLKPENILLALDGTARITDFGLVKTSGTNKQDKTESKKNTIEDIGTPLYMSPEQWLEKPTFARTDIYSFGCIAYELITGNLAIGGRSLEELAQNHIQGVAFQKASNLNIHPSIKTFLKKCVAPHPEERFQTWTELEKELIRILNEVLQIKVEEENIAIDVSKLGQVRKGESLFALGNSYLDINKSDLAIEYYGQAIKIGETQICPELIAACMGNTGVANFNLGKIKEALEFYQKAINIGAKHRLLETVALNFGNKGNAFFVMGDFKLAQEHFEKVIELWIEVQNKRQEIIWGQNLANVYSITGDDERALKYYQKSYLYWKEQNDLYNASYSLINMGTAHERLGNLLVSKNALENALQISQNLGDQKNSFLATLGLSHLSVRQNKTKEAIKHGEMGLSIAEKIKDRNAMADAFSNLGSIYALIGQYDKAVQYINQAMKLANEVNNKQTLARNYSSLGVIMELSGQIPEAIKNLRKAAALFKELGLPEYFKIFDHLQELGKHYG